MIAAPKLKAIVISKAGNGFIATHHGANPGAHPQRFIFPNVPGEPAVGKLLKHVAAHAKNLWLGGKTMEPRVPGSMKAHRQKQLETSSYPGARSSSY